MEDLKSQGKCSFCDKIYTKRGISRHLDNHLKKLEPVNRKYSFHLRIEAGPYFLNLLMDGDAMLGHLDHFLRNIWLECCGHLSDFFYQRWKDKITMNMLARRIFEKGLELKYVYDFGSTTELTIKTISVYPIAVQEGIRILSRNEPLKILCDHCNKKPAVHLCPMHEWDEEDSFCESCAEKHEKECSDAEYAIIAISNSPRMGVCGYEGGTIDLERDGPFKG